MYILQGITLINGVVTNIVTPVCVYILPLCIMEFPISAVECALLGIRELQGIIGGKLDL
jgi:hypothetical protein